MVTPVTADTNRVSLYLAQEPDDSWGEAPGVGALAPKFYELRMTGESLMHNKSTVVSEVIRTDRMRDTLSEVGVAAEGDINFELIFRDMDIMLETTFANQSTFILNKTFANGDVAALAAGNEFDGTAGTFNEFVPGAEVWVSGFVANIKHNGRHIITAVTAGDLVVQTLAQGGVDLVNETPAGGVTFRSNAITSGGFTVTAPSTINSATLNLLTGVTLAVGQIVRFSGFSTGANNGAFRIATLAAGVMTVTATTLITEGAPATVKIAGKRLKNGIARKSLLIEKFFGDIAQYGSFRGCRSGGISFQIESGSIVNGSFSITGKEAIPSGTSVSTTKIAAGITDALNATTNVGAIEEGGIALTTAVRSISLELGNNLRPKPQVGSRSPIDVGYGFLDVTGTLTAYFQDLVMWNKFINHTSTSLRFRFTDSAFNIMEFILPRLYYSNGNPTAPGGNDDVMLPLEFTAVRDPVTNSVMIIDIVQAGL